LTKLIYENEGLKNTPQQNYIPLEELV
jgi:hypothetical protein